jgi:hypothetical protein
VLPYHAGPGSILSIEKGKKIIPNKLCRYSTLRDRKYNSQCWLCRVISLHEAKYGKRETKKYTIEKSDKHFSQVTIVNINQ